jgi:hypothetical protein
MKITTNRDTGINTQPAPLSISSDFGLRMKMIAMNRHTNQANIPKQRARVIMVSPMEEEVGQEL